MFFEMLDGASRASGPAIVTVVALAGATWLMSQLIMHREAERAVPVCEAGFRSKPPPPNLEELGRELTREFLKQTLPELGGLTDLFGGGIGPPKAMDYASRCRCFADAALDDAGLRSRYWFWVGTLKLIGAKPDFHMSMARMERLGVCGKGA
jgi:hypothetical protein